MFEHEAAQFFVPRILSISALNLLIRQRLESGFPLCWVSGEISNLSYASSGHVYFSLKDAQAQLRCVMFRQKAQLLGFRLENGQHIEASVLVTFYEARGDCQLNVESLRKTGQGRLFERFVALKNKLEQEGIFAADRKRPIPRFSRCIGLVTSPQAAALRDVLASFQRRAPHVTLIIYPCLVQGELAAAQLVAALNTANQRAERDKCEVLIVCRGGGSLEDLWPFNDEGLARAIAGSALPIITGVGHETDFTLADFAADKRAPTPTAAAELAAPEQAALLETLIAFENRLGRQIQRGVDQTHQKLDGLASRLIHPLERLNQQQRDLTNLQRRLNAALSQTCARKTQALFGLRARFLQVRPTIRDALHRLDKLNMQIQTCKQRYFGEKHTQVARLEKSVALLNPLAVLERGYSIVMDERGKIVRNSTFLEPTSQISVSLHSGRIRATVTSVSDDLA